MGDYHVRFCEMLEVKFPLPTRRQTVGNNIKKMKIHIELWIEDRKFSRKVNMLFNESVICYKHGAYRASLLFSYLAFITYIKEVLIQSNNPNPSNLGRWTNIQNEIQNDDKWESRIFEELTNSSNPIFDIKEDLRQQIKYWKDRRNDCAHFKSNDIEAHSVETFWSFLKSNLNKITVEGGKASLIKKFEIHFDHTLTPPNSNFDHLIQEIQSAVDFSDFESFLDELSNKIDPIGFYDNDITNIQNKIFELCPDELKEKLSDYLKNKKLDLEFISKKTDKINFIQYSASEIRQIWKTRIFKASNYHHLFDIYTALLRNDLIPTEQLEEALTHLFDKYEQTKHSMPHDSLIKSQLAVPLLGEIIFKKAIKDDDLNSFMWVNSKCDFIAFYVEKYPLKKDTVDSLCRMVTRANYSYWLETKIESIFSENTSLKDKFNEIATQSGYLVPTKFQ